MTLSLMAKITRLAKHLLLISGLCFVCCFPEVFRILLTDGLLKERLFIIGKVKDLSPSLARGRVGSISAPPLPSLCFSSSVCQGRHLFPLPLLGCCHQVRELGG